MNNIKTEQEHLIDVRNEIGHRLALRKADLFYWQKLSKKLKDNTEEKLKAINNKKNAKLSVKNDEFFLKCIDKLLKKY